MSRSKFCLEMVRDLSHCHKIPLETQKATLSKEKKMLRNSLSSQKLFFKVFFEAHQLQKICDSSLYLEGTFVDTKNVTLPLQHQKLHGAASYHKRANAASSIKSCDNQTKTARSFKIAKRRVHMKFRAISTPSGLTSILQRLSRNSRRRQCRRHQIFNQSLWMV